MLYHNKCHFFAYASVTFLLNELSAAHIFQPNARCLSDQLLLIYMLQLYIDATYGDEVAHETESCLTWPAVTSPTLLELCRAWAAVTPQH